MGRPLSASASALIEAASDTYLAVVPQPPESMFDYLFATLPAALTAQRAEVAARGAATEEAGRGG